MPLRSTLTATVTALAVALAVPAPAVAGPDGEDLLKLLAGAAIVGLIAREADRDDQRPAPVPRNDRYYPPVQRAPVYSWQDEGYPHRRGPEYRHGNRSHDARPARLPGECAIDYQGRRGWERVYGANCLADTGFRARLPDYCAMDIRTSRGPRRVYEESCLRDAGFRADGRRY